MQENILTYYEARKPLAPVVGTDQTDKQANKKDAKANAAWQKTIAEVEQLRQYQVPTPDPTQTAIAATK